MAEAERASWREDLSGASSLVFLCSGNVVRSAFAEILARHRGIGRAVRSAATTYRTQGLFPETARALAARGVEPRAVRAFRPTFLADVASSIEPDAVLFGMTRAHLAALSPWPVLAARAHLLAEVLGEERDIADPVLEGADFERTFELVALCVERLVRELRRPGP